MERSEKSAGFTLIELLVVVAIIGVLSSIVLTSLNSARIKARDAKRAQDMHQIRNAMLLYYDQYGCLPITSGSTCGPASGTYDQPNAGGWDYSSQGYFLDFLKTAGFMPQVPVDPVNNMNGDGSPPNSYAYRYYCYDVPMWGSTGPHLGYWKEATGSYVYILGSLNPWADSSFSCR